MVEIQHRPAAAAKPLHLEMPEPLQFESIVASDRDGSSPEETEAAPKMEEEDVNPMVGPSMSRAQTRMMSPLTPAAEKAAALAGLERGGLFDGVAEEKLEGQESAESNDTITGSEHHGPPRTPLSQPNRASLPSPWRASPRQFEKEDSKYQEPPFGPTGMLADINVRRYISSFSLPSLPKTPLFKDLSVPSLASVFSSARSHSPLRKGTRQKRASTFDSRPAFGQQNSDDGSRSHDSAGDRVPAVPASLQNEPRYLSNQRESRALTRPLSNNESQQHSISASPSVPSQKEPMLRRSTSDQSLLLRRATSTKSSLGDDSRWINVQEQVNSRRKAIMDSLQDSKFPIPSMPNMSSFNLNAFRPDFIRSRATSEVKQPSHLTNGSSNGSNQAREIASSAVASRELQPAAETNSAQAPHKMRENMCSELDLALEHLTGDIVVMGGYRGSVLRSAKPPHRQLWVPVKVGLNIRRVNLEVGLEPEDEENMEDSIIPSGMLSHIGPVDMGRRLLKRLRSCKNAQEGRLRVHDYGYDWRLSPHLLSRRLIGFLENLPSNAVDVPAQERGVTVLAHSMGGLVTRHAVNRRPELFAGVVYAGVPQHCINILGPIRNGDEVLLSTKVLTAQVNFTMRSSYVLLPDDGVCFINKETKEEYPVDFFDVEHWKKHAFSPCINSVLPPANGEKKSLLGSLSDSLPSLPSLPLPNRKSSPGLSPSEKPSTTDSTSSKLSNLTDHDPSTARALDPHFSTSGNTVTTIPPDAAYKYLSRTLNQTVAFRSELHHRPTLQVQNRYPPLACLYATNTPTVSRARVSSREAIRCADAYDDLQFASGDGVCLAKAVQLPEGYQAAKGGRVKTERGHVGLLGDLEAVGRCLDAVWRGRRGGVGLGVGTEAVGRVDVGDRKVQGLA